ncbi:MAG: hypothetical protein KBC19_04865 [Candidatus Moranbacteria bacterium]|nr:hypothetical protein [Candidatus Moranbacteria bacterium]
MKNLFEGEGSIDEFKNIAPKLAREDYYNHIIGLSFFLQANKHMTEQEFQELLEKYNFQETPTFSQKYADQKNILDNQPDDLVEKLDALAKEVVEHCKNGTLTIPMYKDLSEKMLVLCIQK